ncbi:acyl-CoA dehydrogenase [Sphingomonas sp. Mn802worker]|uniref:acyl-CoA dehydrogenase n=1 Tax=Sphingomonas sp. Mn802worker TaxID=629773 RepID=UPI0012EA4BFC|nr:acyl-CoA dehydrogenase [Sphingomonas sp. Mn802worker]
MPATEALGCKREGRRLLMQVEQGDGASLVARLRDVVRVWDHANGDEEFPAERLRTLIDLGATSAFVTLDGAAAAVDLLTTLRLIGGADLSLGRIYEGHVNAVQLVHAYGGATQRDALARDLAAGRVYGVWNTEPAPGMNVEETGPGTYRLSGAKSFATGAGHIDRALITARWPDGTKQMVLADVSEAGARVDNSAWQVRGMRGTNSGTLDFNGLVVSSDALIGEAGDYEREPRFSAGAWRFTAVQLGAVEALLRHWRDHLVATGKANDSIQRARIGAAIVATRSAATWVGRASQLAEDGSPNAIAHVLMTRGVVEEAGLLVMEGAARAIGTASFFAGSRVDRITRDLGLYLRQPVPDQARDRAAAAWIEADRWGDDPWW